MSTKSAVSLNPRIKRSRPDIRQDDIDLVSEVLRSGDIAAGSKVTNFENRMKQHIGAGYAKATNSGTNALILALSALDLGRGDEIILPSYVCYSVLSAVENVGAIPVLADLDDNFDTQGFNLSGKGVAPKISHRTAALIIPHMLGRPADLDDILSLGVPVIEDCAQSLGAFYKGKPVGSYGQVSVFSFFATKVISTGYGGMITTSVPGVADRIEDLTRYDQREVHGRAYSCSLTDFQAALGDAQLSRIESLTARRIEIGSRYDNAFSHLNVGLPKRPSGSFPFKYALTFENSGDRDRVAHCISEQNIGVDLPVYRPLHRYLGLSGTEFPNTEKAYAQALTLPCYPALTDDEVNRVINALHRCFGA